jgi:hypothetical protein
MSTVAQPFLNVISTTSSADHIDDDDFILFQVCLAPTTMTTTIMTVLDDSTKTAIQMSVLDDKTRANNVENTPAWREQRYREKVVVQVCPNFQKQHCNMKVTTTRMQC